jgi:hypothetical protein
MLGHIMTILPLAAFKSSMIYYGFGVVGKYEKFELVLRNNTSAPAIDSQEANIGVGGQLGYVYGFGPKYCVRVDGRYYLEKQSYFGYAAALQMKF